MKTFPPEPQSTKQQRTRKRAATDSSSSRLRSSESADDTRCRASRRRKHHSECSPADKCNNTLAKDLGYIIDAILEEHTNTLQDVINNIRRSQPSLAQLRRVSEDLVQRCQVGGICSNPRHMPYQPSYQPCQPICQSVCRPVQQVCEWQLPCRYVPPKVAEKLNVGAPGQLVPNINDRKSSLRESIKTVPDLVDLVNSAADDLGVDLDRLPRARDNELFRNAPVQGSSMASITSQHSIPEVIEEVISEKVKPGEDAWLEQTRRHLTELSEARTQLMDELDEIAEDLGVPSQDHHESELSFNSVQRVLSKISTGLSRKSMRLRNKSVSSVAEGIPRMIDQQINERCLSHLLTRILTQSLRMSAITQVLSDTGDIPPEEIQEWLEVAHSELPAAIDSITTVLETLPILDFKPEVDDLDEQPEYKQVYEPDIEFLQEPEATDEDYTPPQRSRTERLIELQDRVADLERLLRKQSAQLASSDYEEGCSSVSLELAVTSETVGFEPPVKRMAEQELADEQDPVPETWERTATQHTTFSSSRTSNIMSQRAGDQSPFHFSSSEL